MVSFQHTAARRRLRARDEAQAKAVQVSTHSRPKAAASNPLLREGAIEVSTHSRPKAAARPPPGAG